MASKSYICKFFYVVTPMILRGNAEVTPTEGACIGANARRAYRYIYYPVKRAQRGKKMPSTRLPVKKNFAGLEKVHIFAAENS